LEGVTLGPFREPSSQSDLISLAGPNGGGKSSILELIGFALSNTWSLSWQLGRAFPDNSFEVEIAVTSQEAKLIQDYYLSNPDVAKDNQDALEELATNGSYWRGFRYDQGEYQKNAPLNNKIHGVVSAALRKHYMRPLGFFLKSDRAYREHSFDQQRIFQFSQMQNVEYAWTMAFNTSEAQYRDIFDFLVQQRYHYLHRLGSFYLKRDQGVPPAGTPPSDPLRPYNKLLKRLFPMYEFSEIDEDIPRNLYVRIPSGEDIPFHDLSSGEKEVFFILAFFLRQDVSNAVVIIDEPEMHLHPELARTLVRTMQTVKPGNQIWVATHNPEVIDESGPDRVVYISRDPETRKATVALASSEPEAVQKLREMFGFSGYLGVGKCLVFLEGEDSSSDRKVFSRFFPEYGGLIRFVPSQTVGNLARINAAVLAILEENLGWINYYLVRDRDYLSDGLVQRFKKRSRGRMHILRRYHIENYLLDGDVISKVQREVFGQETDSDEVGARLKGIARGLSAEFLKDLLAFRLNQEFQSEDFSLGRDFDGASLFERGGALNGGLIEAMMGRVQGKVDEVKGGLMGRTTREVVSALFLTSQAEVQQAVEEGSERWRELFPGRRLIQEYTKGCGIRDSLAFRNCLIKEMASVPERIPDELGDLVRTISDGGEL
jgi:predicted ATPase